MQHIRQPERVTFSTPMTNYIAPFLVDGGWWWVVRRNTFTTTRRLPLGCWQMFVITFTFIHIYATQGKVTLQPPPISPFLVGKLDPPITQDLVLLTHGAILDAFTQKPFATTTTTHTHFIQTYIFCHAYALDWICFPSITSPAPAPPSQPPREKETIWRRWNFSKYHPPWIESKIGV